jgi:hypothetical protein
MVRSANFVNLLFSLFTPPLFPPHTRLTSLKSLTTIINPLITALIILAASVHHVILKQSILVNQESGSPVASTSSVRTSSKYRVASISPILLANCSTSPTRLVARNLEKTTIPPLICAENFANLNSPSAPPDIAKGLCLLMPRDTLRLRI